MNPSYLFPSLEIALHEEIQKIDCKYFEQDTKISIGISGNAIYDLSPRYLQSIHIGKLICLEGIVTCCKLLMNFHFYSIIY